METVWCLINGWGCFFKTLFTLLLTDEENKLDTSSIRHDNTPDWAKTCPRGWNVGKTFWMKEVSSHVASGRLIHLISHWATCIEIEPWIHGISLRSKIFSGAIRMVPSKLRRGKSLVGTAWGPKCFLSWLIWKVWCKWQPSENLVGVLLTFANTWNGP
jgi:hypothetical protein